ncbi:unnamed protein product [Hymenolepis diminuta]|uniref:Uncharacterized protein n=1 Tax=Hymenolepis diminuta TaxID=6216 RepID=A0A564Y3N4_HYMDI|nr:unnamed protein product [Hymenolepis diminuta]
MTKHFTIPRFNRPNSPKGFLFLELQFRFYGITSLQVRQTCLLKSLALAVSELVYDVLEKQPLGRFIMTDNVNVLPGILTYLCTSFFIGISFV